MQSPEETAQRKDRPAEVRIYFMRDRLCTILGGLGPVKGYGVNLVSNHTKVRRA